MTDLETISVDLHECFVQTNCASVLCAFSGGKAFPHGVLQPLPKRPALEKSNGASSLFNPSVLHYQQALANAQLQQPAFFPTGKSLHSTPLQTGMHVYVLTDRPPLDHKCIVLKSFTAKLRSSHDRFLLYSLVFPL